MAWSLAPPVAKFKPETPAEVKQKPRCTELFAVLTVQTDRESRVPCQCHRGRQMFSGIRAEETRTLAQGQTDVSPSTRKRTGPGAPAAEGTAGRLPSGTQGDNTAGPAWSPGAPKAAAPRFIWTEGWAVRESVTRTAQGRR